MVTEEEVLQALGILAEHPDVRVLTRFRERPAYNAAPPGTVLHKAVYLDLETTGLDPSVAEVIELGAVRFTFDEHGTIYTVGPTFSGYEQPSKPIDPAVTIITGITDDMVAGKVIESAVMDHLMEGVDLVIAHNAEYDRKIAERRWQYRFEHLPWACSYKQIDWKRRGSIGSKLGNILMTTRGMFYDAHRAADDALVGIDILTHSFNTNDGPYTALAELLETTREGVYRVYAHGAPFEAKGRLKARGFFWTGEKPWKRDFTDRGEAARELLWLAESKISMQAQIKRINARHRYSIREESRAVPMSPAPQPVAAASEGPYT